MSVARSVSTAKSPTQIFADRLQSANTLVAQGVRLPFIYAEYNDALELYQQIPPAGQTGLIATHYLECRRKFFYYSIALIKDLIKTVALVNDEAKEQLINHAETILNVRARFLTTSDVSECSNQSHFREQVLHLKQDLEIVKVASNWGLNCISIPKDGNCLFNAIADQLKLNGLIITNSFDNEPHHALRSLAVEHLRVNKECYSVHIPNDITFTGYTDRLAQHGTWGDHLEIMALVRELTVTLVLIQDDQNIIVFKNHFPKAIFYLGYETNYHFVSLHKIHNSSLLSNLETKIHSAPVIESGPYILHAVLEESKSVNISNAKSNKSTPASTDKKSVSTKMSQFFKPSSAAVAEEKSEQQKSGILSLIRKGSSNLFGRR